MSKKLLTFLTLLTLFFGVGWAATQTVTINYNSTFNPTLPSSSSSVNNSATAHTVEGLSIMEAGIYKGSSSTYLMFVADKGYLYNTQSLGTITKVAVTYSSSTSTSGKVGVYFGGTVQSTYKTTNNQTIAGQSQIEEWSNSIAGNGYFQLSTSNKNIQITKIVITYDNTPVTTYNITCNSADHGNISAPSSAAEGATVSVTATPSDGYKLSTVTVNPVGGTSFNASVSGNTATFTMPASNVTIDATFTETVTTQYKLVESATDLVAGAEYMIAGLNTNSAYVALMGTISGNIGTAVQSGFSYNSGTKILTVEDGCTATPITLGGNSGEWTFHNGDGYICHTGDKKIDVSSTVGTYGKWMINTNNLPSNRNLIQNAGNTVYYLQYNSSSPRFTDYNSSQQAVALFKKVEVGAHTITIDDAIDNGSVTANKASANSGDQVILTVTPEAGYEVTALSYNGTAITSLTGGSDQSTYTFTMPNADVTITATFSPRRYKVDYTQTTGGKDNGEHGVLLISGTTYSNELGYSTAEYNSEVVFKVCPEYGYQINTVTATTAGGLTVTATPGETNSNHNYYGTYYTIAHMPADAVTIAVTFKQGDIYIIGTANDNAWDGNTGVLMTYNATPNTYTARVYFKGDSDAGDEELGYGRFSFAERLSGTNGSWSNMGARYGANNNNEDPTSGSHTWTRNDSNPNAFMVSAGVYDITVNWGTGQVTATKVEPEVTLNKPSGELEMGTTVTVTSNLTQLLSTIKSGVSATLAYSTDGGTNYTDGSSFPVNQAMTAKGKAYYGKIEAESNPYTYAVVTHYAVNCSVNPENSGTVTATPASAIAGENVALTISPNTGYEIGSVTVNGDGITPVDGAYSFTMPAAVANVVVNFNIIGYNITQVTTNCTVDVASSANYNQKVTFTVTPRSDKYEVSTVTVTYGDNSSKPVTDNGDGTYSFYMPASDVTLTVTCTRKSTGGNQFTLVKNQTDIVAGGEYVILETNEVNAMSYDGSNYDNPSNQFSLSGDVVTLTDGSNVSIFKLDNGSTNGTFTMQDGTRGYVTTPTSTGGKPSLASTGGNWTINYNNGSFEVKGGSLYLRYNADHFRVYTSSTQGRGVKLYKRLAATAGVEIDPVTGDVIGSQTVFVGSNTDGALVQYKVEKQNGNDWDVVTDWTEWTTYTEANGPIEFTITGNVGDVYQVTARAKEAGQEVEPDEEEDFDEQTVQYTFIAPDAPTINPASGSMSSETQNVTITSDYADGIIEYSTDGGATWNTYMGAFHVIVEGVGESVTVQARVTVNGVTSEVATATYTRGVQPVVFSPASGTYYDDQTCQMFSTSKNARIYYTTDGSEPSKTNGTLYTGEVSMPATGTYQFKAVAYIGNTASTVSSANYNIRPRSEGTGYNENYLLFNVAELNAMKNSFPSGTYQTDGSYTMVNPVQVVWMSTYKNVTNGYPEYCLIRDNTGYGMIYFGKNNSSHAGYKIFDMGDWISGGYNGKVSLAYSQDHGQLDTHPELGASGSTGKKIYQWPESALSNASVLPEYITIPEILASETPGNIDYWGHYVHLRKNTVQLIASDDPGTYTTGQDKDGKWSGTITDENGNQINYYDKFYLQIDSTWTTTSNFFTGHPNRTFDIYGFVACHLPAEIDYQIAPFAFAWIDQPICDHETGTYTSEQTVKITSPNDPEATIWYKTSEMDDYHVYTGPITVNSTTTIEWYATKQSQYNDVLESKKGEITMTFQEIPVPVITPESEVFAVGSSVDASIAFADGVTVPDGTVIRYTIDGSDPNSADALTYVVGETTLHFTATTTVRAIAELGGIYSAEAESKTYTFVKSNGIVYDLVTNVNQITENGIYVIVSQNYNEAMSNVQGETNRGAAGVMFVENSNKGQVYGNDDLAIFTVKEGNHEGEFLFETHNSNVNGFLCVESENNNTLLTEAEMDAMGNDVAVVTIDADGRAHIRYNYSGGDNRYLQYWNRDRYFTTYKTEDADRAVYIYYKNATPLASIEKNGTALPTTNTAENQYTVADQLIAVHYKDAQNDAGEHYLWCKDQGNVSIFKTEKTGDDQIDYLKDVTKVQNGDWDQSNWVVLKFTNPADETSLSNAVGKFIKPASITGHYTDGVNYTITMPQYADLTGKVEDENAGFTPNVYCPANFLDANLNIGDGVGPQGAETGDHYFFMNPKVQEVATVTYAVWNGSHFVIPARANGNNQGNFDGAFSVGWDYNAYGDAHSTLLENTVYTFKGVLNTVSTGNGKSAKAGENANAAGTVEGKDVDPQPGKMVYAFDLKGGADSPNIITAIKDVVDVTGKAVAGVKYYNLAGIESDRPFEGVNIIVTTYTDGSRSSAKVLK